MKPYTIETFDRYFNFRLNALVDGSDFTFKYDILSPEKNTINLPLDVMVRITASEGTPGDGTVCTSDYIRIIGENQEYTGVITKVEKNAYYTVITYMDILCLFDHEAYVTADEVKLSYIEDYLYKLLSQEFISTDDESQRIYGLTITKTSQTVGTFDYCMTADTYTIINLLNDYISPAYRDFVVLTDVSIDIPNKAVNVTIGKIDETNIKTIEGDLPNVLNADYVIRQANDNKNKLELIDTYNNLYTKYDFYLHASDYSFNNQDTDRITPVINNIEEFDSSIITEEAFWKPYNEALQTITKYNDPTKTLTEGEKELLMSAFKEIFPIYRAYAINNYKDEWLADQIYPQVMSEAGSRRLSDDSRISSVSYSAYMYGWTDADMKAWWLSDLRNWPFTIRDALIISPYSFEWGSVAYRNGNNNYWLLTDHGYSFGFGTFLYAINGSPAYPVTAHLGINIPFKFEIGAIYQSGWEPTETGVRAVYSVAPCMDMKAIIQHDITTSEINTIINNYKQSAAYQEAYEIYKQEKFADLLQAYANKVFKTSKYTNNIEITVSPDDPMIKPLEMEIGQVVDIIHDGVSYNSILSGREVQKNGLVKLIFGTIRLELTKILNMKGI
ncbi:MAG: hypothetical protein K6B14_07395 [Lachnospiraceae bacterium]|nr:hypothetical protein [Lachnospiraceae bacterium]